MSDEKLDPAMKRIQEIWAKKKAGGMTLRELGEAMGYGEGPAAASAAHQFMRGSDPRVSSLRRFAIAVKVSAATLMREP